MRYKLSIILFLITICVNAQAREFKNQGEQEDFWTEELFKNEYKEQAFEKFIGNISIIDENTVVFDNKTLYILTSSSEIREIFTAGIFYPQLLIGDATNNLNKTKE